MAKKSKRIIFKGWDYTELVPVLLKKSVNSYHKKYKDSVTAEYEIITELHLYISEMMNEIADSRSEVRAAGLKKIKVPLKNIRNFVKAVAESEKKCGCRYTLIKGLYDIEHDWTFLNYTMKLLDSLWT